MSVKLTELRAISDRLFKYLEETGREEFDIEDDYYWDMQKEELYDPLNDPKDLTLGQLSHDWERLQAIQRDEDLLVGHALVWLASILRNVGERSGY